MNDEAKTKEQLLAEIKALRNAVGGIAPDITGYKRTEEHLLQLKKAVETMQLGVTVTDLNGKIIYTNPAEAVMHGYHVEELLGKDISILAPPELRKPRTLEEIKKWKGLIRESVNIRKDGNTFSVWLMSEIVRSTEGEPCAIVTSCEDISGRKEAEEELRKYQEHLEELVKERTKELTITNENLQQKITEHKKDEKLLKLNKERLETLVQINQIHEFSAEEISDYVLEKAIELTRSALGIINYVGEDNDITAPSLWSKSMIKKAVDEKPDLFLIKNTEIWTEAFYKKTPIVINDYSLFRSPKKDSLEEYVELSRLLIVPVFDEDSIVLLSAVANKEEDYDETDVNELTLLMDGMWNHIKAKLAAEELQKAKEKAETANVQLRELNANKDTFFSIIAHDLRGPLSSLHELTQLIEENLDSYSPGELKEMIVFQKAAAEILYKLLENLLTWSRVQRGMIAYQPQHIDIKWLVGRAIELLKVQAEQKQIMLHSSIQEQMFVYADVNMVDTVIRNLISNALKFTSSSGIIEISAHQGEHEIEVSVSDTGIGIEEEHLSKLFRIDARYRRAGTAQEEGTGLGLILCKEFIERHNGKIWVESQINKGSTFRFTLPKNLEGYYKESNEQ